MQSSKTQETLWILDGNSATTYNTALTFTKFAVCPLVLKSKLKSKNEKKNSVEENRLYFSTAYHAYLAEILITSGYKLHFKSNSSTLF